MSFDALTGRDMACMSHVNSYLRGKMDWMAPVGPSRRALLPDGLLDAYGVERINPREWNLTPVSSRTRPSRSRQSTPSQAPNSAAFFTCSLSESPARSDRALP